MRFRAVRGLAPVAFGFFFVANAVATENPTPVEYSLLQPALYGKYFVVTGVDVTGLVSGFSNTKRSSDLRELVERNGYDAPAELVQQLKAAFDAAGLTAEIEFVPRGPSGSLRRLTRGDLPSNPRGKALLDLEIGYIGLAAADNFSSWEPMYVLTWRLLHPTGEIIVPSHQYYHGPFGKGEKHRSRSCALGGLGKLKVDPTPLWNCFNQAFVDTGSFLVTTVRAAHLEALGLPATGKDAVPSASTVR